MTAFLLLLSGFVSIFASQILFSLILNLIAGGGICTGFVHANVVEKCIPMLGTLFVLTQKPNRRILNFLHAMFRFLFFVAITVSLYHSILWNLILYDAWGLDLDWPYHADYGTYLKYDSRINNFLTVVAAALRHESVRLIGLSRFLVLGFSWILCPHDCSFN
ncbi:hypothetical protein L0152_16545, partial [bacterium]|nr:hypothetical protein [bacterium]